LTSPSIMNTIASYLGFLTSGSPVSVTTTNEDGSSATQIVSPPSAYLSPNVEEEYDLIGTIVLGRAAAGTTAATLPSSFSQFTLSSIDFNPPLSAFSTSKIVSVVIQTSPVPHDVNWFVGIWAVVDVGGRTFDAVRRRAPRTAFIWRSNLTVQQAVEHAIPWPTGRPIGDSLHAVLPGLHQPALHVGFQNQPAGTATPLPAGGYEFLVVVRARVAGRGLFGTI
jgi:hypothetical protein